MKIVAHVDPLLLERELIARVDRAHPARECARTIVLVPNDRLARHVLARLAAAREAWLGLAVLHFGALSQRILREAGVRPPRVLSARLLDAVARRALADARDNRWAEFVSERPGALGRLRGALGDLREAVIAPAAVVDAASGEFDRALAEIYRSYDAALERGLARGWGDAAAVARAALPHCAAFGARCTAVFLYGAYELIGVHLDLVRALDGACAVTALVPRGESAPAYRHSERFVAALAGKEPPAIEPATQAAGSRPHLAALYDEAATPPPDPRFSFRHAQGAAAEVDVALRRALAAVREGCPPEEIVIAARTLEPYAAAVEDAFSDTELPWTSSLGGPLRRDPRVRDLLLMLEVVRDDFPRRATAELLRSPRIHWKSFGAGISPSRLARADALSREARILGGLEEWTAELPRWAAIVRTHPDQDEEDAKREAARAQEREAAALAIASALQALSDAVDPGPRRFGAHAEGLQRVLRKTFLPAEDRAAQAAAAALEGLLDEMSDLDHVLGERDLVPFEEMLAWLDETVGATAVPLRPGERGGIRVLDVMQARGLTCRRLFLLGLNSGVMPRAAREDPIFDDRFRAALRERSGRPLAVQREAAGEERLLLALTVGCATERVDVSWQRADESGRAKTRSLALRELARLATGRAEIEPAGAEHVPSHPEHALEHAFAETALLSASDGILLTALRARGADAIAALGERFAELGPGVRMLRATQEFRVVDDSYDGRVGPPAELDDIAVSKLETLGRCPLRFFFQNVLRVREMEAAGGLFEIAPRDVGNEIHALLERLLRKLLDEGLFGRGKPDALRARARALLEAERAAVLGEFGDRWRRRLPVLGERVAESWLQAIAAFLDSDLRRLERDGLVPDGLELPFAGRLDLGHGASLGLRARIDRSCRAGAARKIADYKTSGDLAQRTNATPMLKGHRLQAPLYALLGGAETEVELLGVGPTFEYDSADGYRFVFSGFADEPRRESFLHTLRTLAGLRARGVYPLRKSGDCDWCPYAAACRHNHPPTLDREEIAADGRAYRSLQDKNDRSPFGAREEAAP